MRRTSQLRGVGMKQAVVVVKADLLKAHQTLSRPEAKKALNNGTFIGDAQVVSTKKTKKKKKGKSGPPPASSANGNTPNQINPRKGYRSR